MKRLLALAAALALLSTAAHAGPRSSGNVAVKGGVVNTASVYQQAGVLAVGVLTQGDFVSMRPKDPLVVIERGAINMPYVELGHGNKGDVLVINPVDDIDITRISDINVDFGLP